MSERNEWSEFIRLPIENWRVQFCGDHISIAAWAHGPGGEYLYWQKYKPSDFPKDAFHAIDLKSAIVAAVHAGPVPK